MDQGSAGPAWARRLRAERTARRWSQRQAVQALRAHSTTPLVEEETLLRNWKRWESGTYPDDFYRPLIAATFGTVTSALFPPSTGRRALPAAGEGETLEIVSRLSTSDLSPSMLDALRITVDRLCSEYPHQTPAQLRIEGQAWLRRMTTALDGRLTLAQHREILALSGWLALLVGCVEADMGDAGAAEATRRAALSLGTEAEHGEIIGWGHEMAAWFALTAGNYRGVIAAAQAGQAAAGESGVSVQLAGQEAKAWARIGDRRQVELALERGRATLERQPYPENLDHHFVVDPAKFDFYAMDCYRRAGEDRLATTAAHEVIRVGTDADGQERTPMRNAEARITLGVAAARSGDVEQAVDYGMRALDGERQSLPSLLMCSRELAQVLKTRHSKAAVAREYLDRLAALRSA
jgi:hypothetical protein